MSTIALRGVHVSLGAREVLHDVDLDVVPGEVLALIGPNGAGKSTVLHVMAGDVEPSTGSVALDGRAVGSIRTSALARSLSVLAQDNAVTFPFLVREVIEMGRAPWQRTEHSARDDSAIASAVEKTDVGHLLHRPFTTLSGGERARVSLARVLAQATPVVLLDEPTAALDLRHQEDVMRVARDLAATGVAVVVVIHDLSLAAAWSHRLALLSDGRIVADGSPAEVLDAALLERVYGLPVDIVERAGSHLVVPVRPVRTDAQSPGA